MTAHDSATPAVAMEAITGASMIAGAPTNTPPHACVDATAVSIPSGAATPSATRSIRTIAVFEAAKGVVALFVAIGLEWLGPTTLQQAVDSLIRQLHLSPSRGPLASLLRGINPEAVHIASAVVLAYAAMRLAEGWGLWRHRAWASWLGCIGSAVYLPFELYALVRHPGWLEAGVLIINLIVVRVLARDLLQRHQPGVAAAATAG